MEDFYARVTIIVTGLCFVGTVANPSRKISISLNPESQRNGDLLPKWSSTSQTSQKTNTVDLPLPSSSQQKHHRSRLPWLKMLIFQRNRLSGTPKGLWKMKSLQSLGLSFNRRVRTGLSDFHGCLQLESIYLKSNKICTVHAETFKGLKKLQVVDLRSNALITLALIVTIALELPHPELGLATDQRQCGESNPRNITSASWRQIWKAICNMSVENEKPYVNTPQIRISRDTHLPQSHLSDLKNFIQSKAERPKAEMNMHLSTLGKETQVGYGDLKGIWPQSLIELRDSQDGYATDRKDDKPPDLALAICLSVFITFVVAFCLGAFARPYIDRLWKQRCLNKRPGSDNAYSNEGFYDDIEAAQHVQHQGTNLCQTTHHLNLSENQNPSWVTEPIPHSAVLSEQMLGSHRMDPITQQSPVQSEDSSEAGSGGVNVFPNGHVAHPAVQGLPKAEARKPTSPVQDHHNVFEESHYDTVAQEYSLLDDVMDRSSTAGPLGTFSSSVNDGLDELQKSQPREVVASFSKTLTHTNTQEAKESMEKDCPEPFGAMGSPMESSEERQVSSSIRELATQQPSFWEADVEKRLSHDYSEIPCNDLPSLMPRWGSDHLVTPTEEPVQRDGPFDPHYDLVTNYESDSDEGSLFTLSSEGSQDTRSLAEEQESVENSGTSQPLPSRNLGEYKDNVTSAESAEDITSERILEKHDQQEAHVGNSLISDPDSCVCETHLENDSSSLDPENILTWTQPPGHKLSHHETQGTFEYGDIGPPSEAVDWHYSLRDLDFSNVDSSPSPLYSDQDPSEPEEHATKEK